ncbi:Rossmann-fold NAD(P)-binding domain-containing protein [Effusibacillus pohliae]|uniref:hypothetical protein n=1 Tax=Effusibacillus pohliae TaxID=232270 RepID=UPI0003A89FB6|nr:hypothetical protein [Effusibacillus pohliae]
MRTNTGTGGGAGPGGPGFQAFRTKSDSPYAERARMIARYVERVAERAPEPDAVVDTIMQAVRSPYPNLRYPVGKGVKQQIWLKRVLPWHWIERTLRNNSGFCMQRRRKTDGAV